jgi:hypothetical protein
MKKISILFSILLTSLHAISQTCYIAKTDAVGLDNSAYQTSLNLSACELQASFPSPFVQQFKVVEFGYYLHTVATKDGMESLWAKMKEDAQQEAPYYLLIAKESTIQTIYSQFRVSIKLPNEAPFACIDEFKLKTIEQQVELAINQKYQSFDGSYFRYAEAEIAGMKKLKDIIFKYTDCCLCCGNKQTGCESCEYIDNSVAACVNSNATFKAQVENFVSEHNCSEKAKEFANFATNLICEDDNYKWQRLEELYELIEVNPNIFLQSCPQPDPIYGDWQGLASFVLSGAPLQRIENSNGTWNVQKIQDASGARVNLDFFAVLIDSLPIVNGSRLTGKQLFDHFRKNINEFAPTFIPYDDPYDSDLWFGENPLGAVMHIIMDALTDGDVIASHYEACCWIFTTLEGYAFKGGKHPVSGNRKFGYYEINGQTVIYTRGVDRTTTWYHSLNDSKIAFDGADKLWHGMQEKLSTYVKKYEGKLAAMPTYEIIHRPKWDDVKQVLQSQYPITSISCN